MSEVSELNYELDPDFTDSHARFDTYCPVSRVAPLSLLNDKGLDELRAYWRNVHGPDLAGMPGLSRYYQHHLGPANATLWPTPVGVDVSVPAGHSLGGLAELGYTTRDAQNEFDAAVDAAGSKDDDKTFLGRGTVQSSLPDHQWTLKNELADLVPNGPATDFGLILAFRGRNLPQGREAFIDTIVHRLGGLLAESTTVSKVRATFCEDNVQSDWDAADVVHPPVHEQYQAFVEVRFKSRLHAAILYESRAFGRVEEHLGHHVSTLHAHRIEATYCMVLRGRRTLAGIYGADPARDVLNVGAPIRWTRGIPI